MDENKTADLVSRYIEATGGVSGGRHAMNKTEVVWLVDHSTRLGELRLELLRALQAALPRSDETEGPAAELKELLTNLIIMQSRLSEREGGLLGLLDEVVESGALKAAPVDEDIVIRAVLTIANGADHIRTVAAR